MLIAVVASFLGFAFDAGSGAKELSAAFAALYVIGCVAAVLTVRQSNVFTAVIQPPLILFVLVPAAYFLMHSSDIHGIKDVLINCGYPLIERFPLMFFTSAAVLLIGLARWYLSAPARRDATASADTPAPAGRLSAKLASLFGGEPESEGEHKPRRHSVERRPNPAANRGARPAKRAGAPSRSRHARPPETETIEPVVDDRPRRRRPRPAEPTAEGAEPRRRPRSGSGREPRGSVPPPERRGAYDDRGRPQRPQRSQRRSRYDDYEPLEPHRPGGGSTHHPVSRVRYRGADESDERSEYRSRRPPPRDYEPDRWEYDI